MSQSSHTTPSSFAATAAQPAKLPNPCKLEVATARLAVESASLLLSLDTKIARGDKVSFPSKRELLTRVAIVALSTHDWDLVKTANTIGTTAAILKMKVADGEHQLGVPGLAISIGKTTLPTIPATCDQPSDLTFGFWNSQRIHFLDAEAKRPAPVKLAAASRDPLSEKIVAIDFTPQVSKHTPPALTRPSPHSLTSPYRVAATTTEINPASRSPFPTPAAIGIVQTQIERSFENLHTFLNCERDKGNTSYSLPPWPAIESALFWQSFAYLAGNHELLKKAFPKDQDLVTAHITGFGVQFGVDLGSQVLEATMNRSDSLRLKVSHNLPAPIILADIRSRWDAIVLERSKMIG